MQRMMQFVFTLTLLIFSFNLYAADVYKIDPNHTYVQWHTGHFGFSEQSGKWYAEGALNLDEKNPDKSSVNVTINVANLATGHAEFDKHLTDKLFLNVKKYPVATFVSDKVTMTAKQSAKVKGMLTLLGVSKPVTLDVKLNKKGINPINDKETVGFSGKTILKRSEFGMTTLLPGVSDEVKLTIELEAYKE